MHFVCGATPFVFLAFLGFVTPPACSITGKQLAEAALSAGLDGVQIYVSPYCNNPRCSSTTGKYAVGIAEIIRSFRQASSGKLEITLLTNYEWDHGEIIVTGNPTAVFSYQTVCVYECIRRVVRGGIMQASSARTAASTSQTSALVNSKLAPSAELGRMLHMLRRLDVILPRSFRRVALIPCSASGVSRFEHTL